MDKLIRAHGNWVVAERFWDREAELKLLIEYLDEGANILLVAPRRMGKTSLMREAARRIQERFTCLHVDLQKSDTAPDAVAELSLATTPHGSLWEKSKQLFGNVLDQVTTRVESIDLHEVGISLRSGLNAGNWEDKGDHLFETLADNEKPVVAFLDEVPILVNRLLKHDDYLITPERRHEADIFMSWLRRNSLKHQGKVRMVLTGSIGLEPVLRQSGLSATLNSFTPFELGPWSLAVSVGCIEALANQYGIKITPNVAVEMVEAIGYGVPHHVEMFFDKVYEECKRRNIREVSVDLVKHVYETGMLSVRGHAELSHMEERLKMVLGPDLHPLSLECLTEAALGPYLTPEAAMTLAEDHKIEGRNSADVLRQILGILEHDGYLKREADGNYHFQSRLLKDWWEARFGFGFQRASARLEVKNGQR
jgi:hypothetical protein